MTRGIVVTTSPSTKDFLFACLKSLSDKYDVLIVINDANNFPKTLELPDNLPLTTKIVKNDWDGFELGGILRGSEMFDEFVLLTDTCIVKNMELIDKMFEHEGSMSLCEGFHSYLGKFISSKLKEVDIPKVEDGDQSSYEDMEWTSEYIASDKNYRVFDPQLTTVEGFRENDFIIKYDKI